jgi:hypothetical protein
MKRILIVIAVVLVFAPAMFLLKRHVHGQAINGVPRPSNERLHERCGVNDGYWWRYAAQLSRHP